MTTIVVVTHDPAVAGRMHHQIEMLDGRIITDTAARLRPADLAGGLGAALLIGAVAGRWPALRAARLSPTEAPWTL